MTGKCGPEWVCCWNDKEDDRDIEQHATSYDDVVQIRADETNNPACIHVSYACEQLM